MSCERCKDVIERSDVPHLVRRCEGCGRELRYVRTEKNGKGIRIEEGEKFVIPKEWLTLSLNPLTGKGRLYRPALQWFAEMVFVDGMIGKESGYPREASALEQSMDDIVNNSDLVTPLDVNKPEDAEKIWENLKDHRSTTEYWAYFAGRFLAIAREARADCDSVRASWATACAERCRSMVIFRDHLEEVVWMGQSIGRVLQVLKTWDARRTEDSEEFWQQTFNEHSYALSQVFAVPVVFIGEKPYIGGMRVDRSGAGFVDYLFSAESSREAILVELKTPTTKLLGRRYRNNVYAPSADLSGAISQVLSYRRKLLRDMGEHLSSEVNIEAFRPKCVLIIGDTNELADDYRRQSFEDYRSSLDVEIVTYDELFRKVEILAELFNVRRTQSEE